MTTTHLFRGLFAALVILPIAASAKPTVHRKPAHPAPARKAAPAQKPAAPAPEAIPAAAKPGDTMIYDGNSTEASGISLAAWGGGEAADTTTVAFANANSIKVTTIDAYQGAKITFEKPISLGDITDKTRYLAFTLRQSSKASPAPPPTYDANSGNGGFDAPDPGAFPGQDPGMPPGADPTMPGGAFPGQQQPGFGPQFGPSADIVTPIRTIHLVLTLANGSTADLMRSLPQTADSQGNINQWISFAVPVSVLGFTAADAASPLQSVTIAGDEYAVLYIGQIKLTHDSTPITCFAGDEQSVAVNQPVTLQGNASGGLSALHFAWDLQTKDQFIEQASGPSVVTAYTKPGDYKVTLTVSDIDGIKQPATSTTVVHVQ